MSLNTLENVADSTDWLSTPLAGLAAVEAALRCQICKDFYKTPMLTSCNHTFCSLCIRRALSSDGKCPLCRANEQEIRLRSNWSMEEVVSSFTQARPAILDFAQQPPPEPIRRSETPRRRTRPAESVDDDQQPPATKRLRSSARLSKTRSMEAISEMARLEADIPDLEPGPEPPSYEPDDGLVACPICWKRMKAIQVDKHLDTSCPGESQPEPAKPALRNSFPKPTGTFSNAFTTPTASTFSSMPPKKPVSSSPGFERLPALNYSMLKDAGLRKELIQMGLSSSGNRSILERRHREWMMIWNANCDSQRPRQPHELRHDLDVWERTLGSRAPATAPSRSGGAQIRDKDFDGAAWAAKHDDSFRELIANAQRSKAKAQQKAAAEPEEKDQAGAAKQQPGIGGADGAAATVVDSNMEDVRPTVETRAAQYMTAPKSSISIDLTADDTSVTPIRQALEGSQGENELVGVPGI